MITLDTVVAFGTGLWAGGALLSAAFAAGAVSEGAEEDPRSILLFVLYWPVLAGCIVWDAWMVWRRR